MPRRWATICSRAREALAAASADSLLAGDIPWPAVGVTGGALPRAERASLYRGAAIVAAGWEL